MSQEVVAGEEEEEEEEEGRKAVGVPLPERVSKKEREELKKLMERIIPRARLGINIFDDVESLGESREDAKRFPHAMARHALAQGWRRLQGPPGVPR